MPWTLYRYILRDVLKLLALSTGVLMVVMGFGAAIKPISDGLLDAGGMLSFLAAMMPPMLLFALPFSTAFSVTLVFCRMAADNEIVACGSSGISYFKLLLPIALLGGTLAGGLFIASNWLLPRFTRVAMSMVQEDVIKAFAKKIENRESVKLGDWVVYANQAEVREGDDVRRLPDSDVQPAQEILLQGVAMGQLDKKTKTIRGNHTAEQAHVLVFRQDDRTWVQVRLVNPLYDDPESGDPFVRIGKVEQMPTIELESREASRPNELTWEQSWQTMRYPARNYRVRRSLANLRELMVRGRLYRAVEQALTGDGDASNVSSAIDNASNANAVDAARFPPELPANAVEGALILNGDLEGERYVIRADRVATQSGQIILSSERDDGVQVDHYRDGKLYLRFVAPRAVLQTAMAETEIEPRLVVEMQMVKIIDPRMAQRPTEKTSQKLTRLRWPAPLRQEMAARTTAELIDLAETQFGELKVVQGEIAEVRKQVRRLRGRIITELHSRAAAALCCLLGALLGAVLAMHLRGALPLVVYFWTFLALVASLLLASTGTQLSKEEDLSIYAAVAVLWLGIFLMILATGVFYSKLSRN